MPYPPAVDNPIDFGQGRCRFADLLGGSHPIVIFGEMLPHRRDLQPFDRFETQRYASRPEIAAIDALLCQIIERITLPFGPFPGDA